MKMNISEIRNATPHSITIISSDGNNVTIQPSGNIARLGVSRTEIDQIDGIPVNLVTNIEDPDCWIPPVEESVLWIVSKIFADAFPERNDLVFPDDAVRDEQGRIIGCRALGKSAPKVEFNRKCNCGSGQHVNTCKSLSAFCG